MLPLKNGRYALQPSIRHLTHFSLLRCFHRHGISRLLDMDGGQLKRQSFKRSPISYVHIDIAEVRNKENKLYLFVALDRSHKFSVAQLVKKANQKKPGRFWSIC